MSQVPYKSSDAKWFWRGPEPAYADFDNNGTKDEINLAAGTFWALPVFIGSDNQVHIRKKKKWSKYKGAGSRFHSKINHDGYEEIVLTFEGPVYDRQWLYYLTDQCVTTDNTPVGYNTHTSDSTIAITNPPKSFELIHYIPNDKAGGGESVYELFTGCIVTGYKEKASVEGDGIVIGTWTVKARNIIAANALDTPPSYPAKAFFNIANAALTWTKAATAYNCLLKGYEFEYTTDKALTKGGGDYYPVCTKSPNAVDAHLKVTVESWETDVYDDTQDDPLSAQDKDATLKISRNTTNDYFSIAIPNQFQELIDEAWTNGNLYDTIDIQINPHESGSKLTLVEVNDIVDDRYET